MKKSKSKSEQSSVQSAMTNKIRFAAQLAASASGKHRVSSKPEPRKGHDERRKELRDSIWSDASDVAWSRHGGTKGFTTIPRLLALTTSLFRQASKQGDPSSVYWDLWCRTYDEGFVRVENELECAFSSGYTGARAVRTWRERMDQLEDWGFIRIEASGNEPYANVLIVNPLLAAARANKSGRPKPPAGWWNAFKERAAKIKADIPEV